MPTTGSGYLKICLKGTTAPYPPQRPGGNLFPHLGGIIMGETPPMEILMGFYSF